MNRTEAAEGSGEHPPTPSWKKALFSAAVLLLAFALLELALALLWPDPGWQADVPALREQLAAHAGKPGLWSDAELLAANFSIYEDDRRLLWRIKPGLDLEITNFLLPPDVRNGRKFRLATNTDGFRGPSSPGTGTSIVLCLGDSNTFGWGLDEGASYPERLFRDLEARKPGAFSVVNLAQPGYSSEQGLRLWMDRGPAMRPSHVVIAFGFNDGIKSSVPDRESIKKRSGTAGAVREALMLTRTYRLARRLVAGIGRGSGSSTAMAPRVDAASYRSNIESIASMARACGATPVIVSVRNKYPDQAADAALALGTALVDADSIAASVLDELVGGGGDPEWRRLATARFGETVLKERPRWWVDADVAHYAEIVHARLAEEIASIIMGKR